MAPVKVPITLSYDKPGTKPPLFVAGTFSDPVWEPQEMDCFTDEEGNHSFHKTVEVAPGAHIQYKIRVGAGDWWVLNESAPRVTDDAGNENNLFQAPPLSGKVKDTAAAATTAATDFAPNVPSKAGDPASSRTLQPSNVAQLQELEQQRMSSTPIAQVSQTAADVADTAMNLDAGKDVDREMNDEALAIEANTGWNSVDHHQAPPLFTHECLGAYNPMIDEGPLLKNSERLEHCGTVDYDIDKYDLNDPALELLPSDRKSIMDTVRKVETGRNEDQTYVLGSPLSPIMGGRRTSVDSQAVLSDASSPQSSKKPEAVRTKSHSSIRSYKSLGSLAEEDEAAENGSGELRPSPAVRVPSPAVKLASENFTTPASDEDEGVVLQSSRSKVEGKGKKPDCGDESKPKVPGLQSPLIEEAAQPNRPAISVQAPNETHEIERSGESGAADGPTVASGITVPTAADDGGSQGQLRRRNVPSDERPDTPSSIHSNKQLGGGNWLSAFFRVVFVDWIGGFVSRLCGGGRKN